MRGRAVEKFIEYHFYELHHRCDRRNETNEAKAEVYICKIGANPGQCRGFKR